MVRLILKKAIAFFIDFFVISLFFMAIALGLGLAFGTQNPNDVNTIDFSPSLGIGLILFYFFLVIFYPAFTEYKYQSTLGHSIVGLKVVRIDGSKMTFSTALKRRLPDMIELYLFPLALILNLATDGYRRLGDLWAGTVVIERNAEQPTAYLNPTEMD
jgi:uncharacterized RDD family membrane protein YckC